MQSSSRWYVTKESANSVENCDTIVWVDLAVDLHEKKLHVTANNTEQDVM